MARLVLTSSSASASTSAPPAQRRHGFASPSSSAFSFLPMQRQQPIQSQPRDRRTAATLVVGFVRRHWKLLAAGKLAMVLLLAVFGAQHQQHLRQASLQSQSQSQPQHPAPPVATTSSSPSSSRPRYHYSVWRRHGHGLLGSLRQRWGGTKPAPRDQSVSVVTGPNHVDGDDGGNHGAKGEDLVLPARRCAPPKPPQEQHQQHEHQQQHLHNQAFFLGGQAFDRVPPPDPASLRPRGVVISATGTVERLAVGAYITAFLVRRVLGSPLPIEIYHVGEREAFAPELKRQLEALGDVKVIDLVGALEAQFGGVLAAEAATRAAATTTSDKQAPPSNSKSPVTVVADSHLAYLRPSVEQLASYAAKAYALLVAPFREAVLFDAGAVPFQDPAALLALPDYRSARGFLVFRDYVPWTAHKWDWMKEEFCIEPNDIRAYYGDTEGDSSCVAVDRVRNWDALLVAAILNGPLQHTTYSRLLGDKDTWAMAVLYARGGVNAKGAQQQQQPPPLPALHTVPGFLFVDYEGTRVGRKVHGQLQLLKVDDENDGGGGVGVEEVDKGRGSSSRSSRKHGQGPAKEGGGGLLVPLYFNNQLFNFTQWQWNKGWTFVGSYDDYGSLYRPPTSLSPDCQPYPVEHLDPLTPVMERAFDGVVEALRTIGSTQCGCRDDWPSACVTFIY